MIVLQYNFANLTFCRNGETLKSFTVVPDTEVAIADNFRSQAVRKTIVKILSLGLFASAGTKYPQYDDKQRYWDAIEIDEAPKTELAPESISLLSEDEQKLEFLIAKEGEIDPAESEVILIACFV